MAVINFDDYRIKQISYQKNENFDNSIKEIEFVNDFSFNFEVNDDENKAIVWISFSTGELSSEIYPFHINVEIEGYFSYDKDKDESGVGFEKFLKYNCAAILFPYLRNAVANITNLANDFPTYNLPTINITKEIEYHD